MSDAAFTLSTAPIWSTRIHSVTTSTTPTDRKLTALRDVSPDLWKLNEDNVAKALLSVVRDAHDAHAVRVVERDGFVILRVPLRCSIQSTHTRTEG